MFNGSDYQSGRDKDRLLAQHIRIFSLMSDGCWRTLGQISEITGDPPASVSAQLRHLRKPRFGSHTVEKNYAGNGLYHYRLLVNSEPSEEGEEDTDSLTHESAEALPA